MIIKKFVGRSEDDAVENAKKELGSSIVIMNVRAVKHKGLFGFLRSKQTEVTVALEEERENLSRQEKKGQNVKNNMPVKEKKAEPAATENLEKKLDTLQNLLENQLVMNEKNAAEEEQSKASVEEEKADTDNNEMTEQDKIFRLLYNTLIDNEVDEKFVNQLLEEPEKNQNPGMTLDLILAGIYQKMILKFGKATPITKSTEGPHIVFFLGPTGVGKTTTIAKLSSIFAVERKNKIALLTTDTYRIAAAEQLRTYADILEVPFRVVYSPEEFAEALSFFKNYDYIFVDSAGHSHQNEIQLEEMRGYIDVMKDEMDYQCFLVLSATTKYKDLIKIASNYGQVADHQLIFTKLDETTTLGNLYNLRLITDTPVAYVTYGQNVPNDIEEFDPQKTVRQLLGGQTL